MKTLLVLEDEPSVMKLLRHMLKEYHVIEATTPEEALILFTDLNYQVDLLVADLTLPIVWITSGSHPSVETCGFARDRDIRFSGKRLERP